jgi:hypothetical protein
MIVLERLMEYPRLIKALSSQLSAVSSQLAGTSAIEASDSKAES